MTRINTDAHLYLPISAGVDLELPDVELRASVPYSGSIDDVQMWGLGGWAFLPENHVLYPQAVAALEAHRDGPAADDIAIAHANDRRGDAADARRAERKEYA